MSTEVKKEIQIEIAHVLFIDIVGYSKLLINEQHELLQELNQIVRATEAFRVAEAAGKLIRLPTGDGMALAFATTPEAPVQCALGINMAQRVMDCGNAGHILVSRRAAEDLEQYRQWQPYLHDLGECEVKHGVRVSVVNLYTEELGNPEVPEKFRQAKETQAAPSAIPEKSIAVLPFENLSSDKENAYFADGIQDE